MDLNRVFAEWPPDVGVRFAKNNDIVRGRHTLGELDLFTDNGLAELIDSSPPANVWIYTMGQDPTRPQDWKVGRRAGLSGEQLIKALKVGRLWINVTGVQIHNKAYEELVHAMYEALRVHSPGFQYRDYECNVLISSPQAMVYYHADALPNMLWHIRGKKKMFLYPPEDDRFAPQDYLERIFAAEISEELPYQKDFDAYASVHELHPGDVLAWPQNSPHRVENTEELNVSLSTEHRTPEGSRREMVYSANHFFRQRLGLPIRSTRTDGVSSLAKRMGFRAFRKASRVLGYQTARFNSPKIAFEVDLEAPECVRLL